MRRISVGDIMTRNFASVTPKNNLHKCAKTMARNRVDSLIVKEKERLLGILTARDILWVISKKPNVDLRKINCMDIAKRKLAVIKPSSDLSQALNKMQASNFRRLPVLSKGRLIGVVTLKDILAIEPNLYHEVRNIMDEIKEEERKFERSKSQWPLEGICENCGAFSELLKVDETLLCQDCREEMY